MPTTTFSPPYPNKFQSGDVAIAKEFVRFCDGTEHHVGQEIVVEDRNKSYYNVCHQIYEKKQ